MSVFPAARRRNGSCGPLGGLAVLAGIGRWATRAIGAALVVCTLWLANGVVAPFFCRGPLAAPAKRIDLVISVNGAGTIEGGKALDIKCRVRGWSSILEIAPDGSYVRKGDLLLRLGSASLRDEMTAERVALGKAEAAAIAAHKACQAASIAIDEYANGTYVQQRLEMTRAILLAQRRLAGAESSLLRTRITFRKGFGLESRLKALQRSVEKAQAELEIAERNRDVLDEFTRAKTLAELNAKHAAATARLQAAESAVQSASAKIQRLQEDLTHCEVRAPREGMVVYAGRSPRGPDDVSRQSPEIYPGARVRQFQTLLRLADLERLQVKLVVAENDARQLRRGQRAQLRVLDQELQGEVSSIDDRPEDAAPAGNDLKQYAVFIAIIGDSEFLKPGMTAEVEILVKRKQNALAVPVVCVTGEGSNARVWVNTRHGAESRKVMLGITNEAWVEIIDGLKEDEPVLLNPGR